VGVTNTTTQPNIKIIPLEER